MSPRRTSTTRRRLRSFEALFVLAVLGAAAGVTVLAGSGQQGPKGDDGVLVDAVAAQAAVAETRSGMPQAASVSQSRKYQAGERVYLRDCAYCHGVEGEGSERGPSLKEAGPAAAHFQLTTGRMPLPSSEAEPEPGPPAYPPETIDALIDYVGTLGSGPEVPEVGPGDLYRGRTLFLYNCAPCHSSAGTGMIVPRGGFAPELFDSTPTQVVEAIRLGPGPMPPFSDRQLDKEQVDSIARYVQHLGEEQNIGGQPLDWIGPIYEGGVAWLIGIPVLVLVIRLLGKKAK